MKLSRLLKIAGAAALALAITVAPVAVTAQVADSTVHVGSTFNDLLIAYASVLGTLVSAVVAWGTFKLTGIRLDQSSREAIQTFAANGAGEFMRRYTSAALDKLEIDVKSPEIAAIANGALARIPDALDHFKLSPSDLQQIIVEKIGLATANLPPATSAVPGAAPV